MPLGGEPDWPLRTSNETSNRTSNTGAQRCLIFSRVGNGTWHFVRPVPLEFAAYDGRGVIKHSTKVRVSDDRTGRRAAKIALKLNIELEASWQAAVRAQIEPQFSRYEDARRQSRALGFEYVEIEQVLTGPIERLLERLEALKATGVKAEPAARAAVLGTEKSLRSHSRSSPKCSRRLSRMKSKTFLLNSFASGEMGAREQWNLAT